MTSSRQSRVLLVVPGRSERDDSKVADLRRETDYEVVVRRPATAAEFLRELGPTIDCVVCCADGEAEQIAAEASEHVPTRTLVFEDEGHGFSKLENRIEAYRAVVGFLDEHV